MPLNTGPGKELADQGLGFEKTDLNQKKVGHALLKTPKLAVQRREHGAQPGHAGGRDLSGARKLFSRMNSVPVDHSTETPCCGRRTIPPRSSSATSCAR